MRLIKMEAAGFSGRFLTTYQTTRHNIAKESIFSHIVVKNYTP
jgi:hypothetical protein